MKSLSQNWVHFKEKVPCVLKLAVSGSNALLDELHHLITNDSRGYIADEAAVEIEDGLPIIRHVLPKDLEVAQIIQNRRDGQPFIHRHVEHADGVGSDVSFRALNDLLEKKALDLSFGWKINVRIDCKPV